MLLARRSSQPATIWIEQEHALILELAQVGRLGNMIIISKLRHIVVKNIATLIADRLEKLCAFAIKDKAVCVQTQLGAWRETIMAP